MAHSPLLEALGCRPDRAQPWAWPETARAPTAAGKQRRSYKSLRQQGTPHPNQVCWCFDPPSPSHKMCAVSQPHMISESCWGNPMSSLELGEVLAGVWYETLQYGWGGWGGGRLSKNFVETHIITHHMRFISNHILVRSWPCIGFHRTDAHRSM